MATHRSIQRGQIPVGPKDSEKCVSHRQNNVIFACMDCQILICATCSIGLHKPHELVEISSLTSQNKTSLQDFINDNEGKKLPRLRQDILSARQLLTPNSTKFKGLAKIIKSQVEKCKEEMEILADSFISLCDKMESDNEELVQQYIAELEQMHDRLTEQTKECKKTLQSGDNIEMYVVVAEVNSSDSTVPCVPSLTSAQFNPGQDLSDKLKGAIGTLDISADQQESSSQSIGSGQTHRFGKGSGSGQTHGFGKGSGSGQTHGFGQVSRSGGTRRFGQGFGSGQTRRFGGGYGSSPAGRFGQASSFSQVSISGQAGGFGQGRGFGQASRFGQASGQDSELGEDSYYY